MGCQFNAGSRLRARITCRLIPSLCAIGTMGSKHSLHDAVIQFARSHGIRGTYDYAYGLYVVTFEGGENDEAVRNAVIAFTQWLSGRNDFVSP